VVQITPDSVVDCMVDACMELWRFFIESRPDMFQVACSPFHLCCELLFRAGFELVASRVDDHLDNWPFVYFSFGVPFLSGTHMFALVGVVHFLHPNSFQIMHCCVLSSLESR